MSRAHQVQEIVSRSGASLDPDEPLEGSIQVTWGFSAIVF
jgi:hypothetical protein